MRIVFMGTPDFAVPSLEKLHQSEIDVVTVITAPDRPAGRGRSLRASAVKQFAVENDIAVLQPTNLKDPHFQEELKKVNADLFVVVAFRMLPESVWNMPPKGTINLHASLLPDYRGAAPINWALINGESKTGVTTFYINEKIDTGSIIFREEVAINDLDDVGILHDKLMETGAQLLLKTVIAIKNGEAPAEPQLIKDEIKTAPKLNKENTRIDFYKPAQEVHNQIRGLSPYPGAYCIHEQKGKENTLKIFRSHVSDESTELKPGHTLTDNRSFLKVGCLKGVLDIEEIQIAGKKRMKIGELLNGFDFDEGTIFH